MKLCRIINREIKETRKDAMHPARVSKAVQEARAGVPAAASRATRADNDPASKDSRVRAADHNRKATGRPR